MLLTFAVRSAALTWIASGPRPDIRIPGGPLQGPACHGGRMEVHHALLRGHNTGTFRDSDAVCRIFWSDTGDASWNGRPSSPTQHSESRVHEVRGHILQDRPGYQGQVWHPCTSGCRMHTARRRALSGHVRCTLNCAMYGIMRFYIVSEIVNLVRKDHATVCSVSCPSSLPPPSY